MLRCSGELIQSFLRNPDQSRRPSLGALAGGAGGVATENWALAMSTCSPPCQTPLGTHPRASHRGHVRPCFPVEGPVTRA